MAAGVADVIEIVVLAAGADAFLRAGGARVVALFLAQKTSLNWFIPALANSSVGSLAGTSDELRTTRCPCAAKYSRNFWRSHSLSCISIVTGGGKRSHAGPGAFLYRLCGWSFSFSQ